MASDPPFVAHALELLAPLGEVRACRMFGGHGLYLQGLFMAIIADDCLYLKADAETQPLFVSAGCQPFAYTAKGDRRVVMSYWRTPDDAMDSPGAMAPWARLALASALRAAAAKPPAATRRPRAQAPQAQAPAKRKPATPTKRHRSDR
jgi:DNA transformation protein